MFDKKDQIASLIRKYLREELTPDESLMLEAWLSEDPENRNLLTILTNDDSMEAELRLYASLAKPDMWSRVQLQLNSGTRKTGKIRRFFVTNYRAIAACIAVIVLLASILWYFFAVNRGKKNPVAFSTTSDKTQKLTSFITNKAELLLANGFKIPLHEKPDGPIELQGTYRVFKHKDDLYYQSQSGVVIKDTLYNTVSTPRGGHYRVIFPDGSAITMNVVSSIRFKVSSSTAIREVTMTGEAEFDITPNAAVPFSVTIPPGNGRGSIGKVEATGTRFNINAYEDGDCKKITLLNGGLKVSTVSGQNIVLGQPSEFIRNNLHSSVVISNKGDQAQLKDNGSINVVHGIDTDSVIAWKKGSVFFTRTPTRTVLSTLEKWYDVEVVYKTTKVPDYPFTGKITPDTDIETVLEIMQFQCDSLHLKFDRAQKKITVLP